MAGVAERGKNIALALEEDAALGDFAGIAADQGTFFDGEPSRQAQVARLPDARLAAHTERAFNLIRSVENIANLHTRHLLAGPACSPPLVYSPAGVRHEVVFAPVLTCPFYRLLSRRARKIGA